jgi:DNA-binding response OmpR family regulator
MATFHEETICVIEDNTPIRKLFTTLLKKSGYSTVDFSNGTTALEWLKDNISKVIILDILLPDANGQDILKYIRKQEHGAKATVIAVTGYAQENDKTRFLEIGFDAYIPKPINTSTFVEQVQASIVNK